MNKYLRLRKVYLPTKKIRTIFILESPPASGKYFYNPKGRITEPLFSAMMKCVLRINPATKLEGLIVFQKAGYVLVDTTYTPVNHLTKSKRNGVILGDYHSLVADLKKLSKKARPRIILVKANICRLLENKLIDDGLNVVNKGVVIPFPSSGQQGKFYREIKKFV